MNKSETLYFLGVPIGRIVWNTERKKAWFETRQRKLRNLEGLQWDCPVQARDAVIACAGLHWNALRTPRNPEHRS